MIKEHKFVVLSWYNREMDPQPTYEGSYDTFAEALRFAEQLYSHELEMDPPYPVRVMVYNLGWVMGDLGGAHV
jgi:hypothetical protein